MRVINHLLDRIESKLPVARIPLSISPRKKVWVVIGAVLLWLLLFGGAIIGVVIHLMPGDTSGATSSSGAVDHRARCLAAAASGDHEGVIREANAWASAHPAGDSEEIAHAVAGEIGYQQDAVFDLLAHKLGRAGADQLYDLAWGASAADQAVVATRAKNLLADESVATHLSQALTVTIAIRTTSNICDAKTKYFAQAAKVGDSRTLDVLTPYAKKGGCGRRGRVDCHPCLRSGEDSLDKTVAAIRARAQSD